MKVNLFPHPKQSVLVQVNPTQPNETASSNHSFTLLESVPQGYRALALPQEGLFQGCLSVV